MVSYSGSTVVGSGPQVSPAGHCLCRPGSCGLSSGSGSGSAGYQELVPGGSGSKGTGETGLSPPPHPKPASRGSGKGD